MSRFINLAILALLLYVAYSYGLPWFQDQFGGDASPAEGGGRQVRCVRLADEANDTFGSQIKRRFRMGGDLQTWERFVASVETRIEEAQIACRCGEPSCRKATEAMHKLRENLDGFDERFRGTSQRLGNPVEDQIAVNNLLNEARNLAREGR